MPDSNGQFKSAFYHLTVERHTAIFGKADECDCEHYTDCDESENCKELEPEIEFAPDPSIDGAWFQAE